MTVALVYWANRVFWRSDFILGGNLGVVGFWIRVACFFWRRMVIISDFLDSVINLHLIQTCFLLAVRWHDADSL